MEIIKKIICYVIIITQMVMLVGVLPARAEDPVAPNWMCAQDLNNNGYIGDEGEYQNCKIATVTTTTPASSYCLPGYIMQSNGTCIKYEYSPITGKCPEGYFIQGGQCLKEEYLQAQAYCPAGYSIVGAGCQKVTYTAPTQSCPAGNVIQNGRCVIQSQTTPAQSCPSGTTLGQSLWALNGYPKGTTVCGWYMNNGAPRQPSGTTLVGCQAVGQIPGLYQCYILPNYVCNQGSLVNGVCVVAQDNGAVSLTCPNGAQLINNQCVLTESTNLNYLCQSGTLVNGNQCKVVTSAGPVQAVCPAGSIIQNDRCVVQTTSAPANSCPANTSYFGLYNGTPACKANNGVQSCYDIAGWTKIGCERQQVTNFQYVFFAIYAAKQYCPTGILNGTVCQTTTDAGAVQGSCPTGTEMVNGQCQKTITSDTQYQCEKGTLNGDTCTWGTTENYCPLGADAACLANGGGASCSANKCVNIEDNKPVDEGNIDGSMLVDDGKRNDEGVCMDQVFIFSGRAQDCKLAGVSTAFKNCCKSEGKVFTDSAGALGTISTAASTISKVYGAAQEAYTYYSVAMQATGDAAVASSMAAQGFGNAMVVAFDPTSLAISVAIYFAMEYLMKACDQQSMETAMTAGSGYCHEVGTYCKKKIPLLGCVQKAKSYCCFNSKLARIIHEQGRPQLKGFNGWGDAGSPACRGFTPDEFSSIDFGKIDLSEYVEDMVKKATSEIQQNVNQITQDFYDKTN